MELIVKRASAGSGKTFQLTQRFLTVALTGNTHDYRRILAITFTNEAAREMKQRITETLHDFAEGVQPNSGSEIMLTAIAEQTGISKKELCNKARPLLHNMLHRYSDLSVSTIDSFAHRIIRSFSFDLGLSGNFNVELDGSVLTETTADELLHEIGADKQITEILEQYVLDQLKDEKTIVPQKQLQKHAESLLQDYAYEHVKKLKDASLRDLTEIKDAYRKIRNKSKQQIIDAGENGLKILAENGITDKNELNRGSLINYFEKLKKFDLNFTENKGFKKALSEGPEPWLKKNSPPEVRRAVEDLYPQLAEMFEFVNSKHGEHIVAGEFFNGMYQSMTIKLLVDFLHDVKERNATLHISDFNKYIYDHIMKEPVPFIYERIGEFYKHYMIDEFQDTSKIQWLNLIPLTGNALTQADGSLFIVGDAKQSIYRWRGGDTRQFINLPELPDADLPGMPDWKNVFQNVPDPEIGNKGLETNRRSKKEIVLFNNAFFKHCGKTYLDGPLSKVYEGGEQKPFEAKGGGGYVRFEINEENNGKKEDLLPEVHEKTARLIKQLLRPETRYKGKDIFILCRRGNEIRELSSYLKSNGVEVFTDNSIRLSETPETRFIAALFKLLLHPESAFFRTEMLMSASRSPYFERDYTEKINRSILKAPLYEFLALFEIPANIAESESLYSLYENSINALFPRNKELPSLITFGNELHRYINRRGDHISGFLDEWDARIKDLSTEMNVNERFVRIMTIHKSKGLQAPVVIMPFLNNALSTGEVWKNRVWAPVKIKTKNTPEISSLIRPVTGLKKADYYDAFLEEEIAQTKLDNLNNLYVGFTRAEERLYGFSYKADSELQGLLEGSGMFGEAENGIYEYGTPEIPAGKEKKAPDKPAEYPGFNSFDYHEKLNIVPRRLPEKHKKEKSAQTMGNIAHELLELIRKKSDAERLIASAAVKYDLNIGDRKLLEKWITGILDHPQAGALIVTPDALNEREIFLADKNKTVRPDKVVRTENGYTVLDFKTGTPAPEHQQQMLEYEKALTEAGINVTEKLIVYLDTGEVKGG